MSKISSLEALLNPRNVALVGASSSKGKIGWIIRQSLKEFSGEKFPVNIKSEPINGQKPFKNVLDIDSDLDLVVCIPAASVVQVLKECVQKRVRSVIVISGGFTESGEAGRKLEDELKRIITGSATRVLSVCTFLE